MNAGVFVSPEMVKRAEEEAKRREPYITHHFSVEHLSDEHRNEIGFLGEFACCELLGIDWRSNIRHDYLTIDNGDIRIGDYVFDVKTETVPETYFQHVIERTIPDDGTYGRRLIMENQVPLLKKYDGVIFGAFMRGCYDRWHAIGYISASHILENYAITKKAPFGADYPEAAVAVRTSELGDMGKLIRYAKRIQRGKKF